MIVAEPRKSCWEILRLRMGSDKEISFGGDCIVTLKENDLLKDFAKPSGKIVLGRGPVQSK
jgi:hypothetical protein